ncbi:uncharacterized protein LOC128556755 [Mercenaria mercenaria]|uniref:uncharacterized protein LOC128556755 n=1 Tax=Mercenaria mercenaria TaxID=6596 RepID=UPI00234EE572|nr:uncharacterized protein LOC128556755 [Mercenaria mercenaria]
MSTMISQVALWVLFFGYDLNCLSNGESNISAGVNSDKEIVSGELHALSRHQRDADIPLEHTRACGIPPVQIDKRFYWCDNGVIVAFTTTGSTMSKSMASTTTSKPPGSCRGLLTCNGIPFCGADQGYRCCGFERYNPEFQTCCQYTSAKYKVYDDMQEKSHVCCGLKVYKRNSPYTPCEHASSNSRFFTKPAKLKRLKGDQALCTMNENNTLYVYKIDVEVQVTMGNRRYLEATISMWPWTPSSRSKHRTDLRSPPTKKGYMEIPLDKYSPWKKNLIGRGFFTITQKNYLEKVIFFLNPNNNIYKWPKSVKRQRKVSNVLKKIQRQCRRQRKQAAKLSGGIS